MIELKEVSTVSPEGHEGLKGYSRIIRNSELCRLDRRTGELVISAILGFNPVVEGYLCIDGMPLNQYSVAHFRRMTAYIPSPVGFEKTSDVRQKQLDMIERALESDAGIILAIDPCSHLSEEESVDVMYKLGLRAGQGTVVVVAADRQNI